jgi:hypothetical protein
VISRVLSTTAALPAPNALADASELFHTPVYDRGAMTLQALRQKVGQPTFLEIVRSWYAEQLDQFFQAWLFEEGRPESW